MVDKMVWWCDPDADLCSGIYEVVASKRDTRTLRARGSHVTALLEEMTSLKTWPPLCGYSGGKRRLAKQIVDLFSPPTKGQKFLDLGCGSGAITMELIRRGISPQNITAVDAGPWGDFWVSIGKGEFDLAYTGRLFKRLGNMPPQEVQHWLEKEIALQPFSPENFIFLQAGSFGSTPLWHDGDRWRRGSFNVNRGYKARGYWTPTPASKETKPRGTIFASDKMEVRLHQIAKACLGLLARKDRVEDIEIEAGSIVYVDPPYKGTSGYGFEMCLPSIIEASKSSSLYISEGSRIEGASQVFCFDNRKAKALNGKSKRERAPELLCYFPPTGK
jgi:16S rRNA G966 N2-methylase RsmD